MPDAIGSGLDYDTVALWEAAYTDMTGLGEVRGEVNEAEAIEGSCTISGQSNVDASNYLHLTAADAEWFGAYKNAGGFKLTYDESRGAYLNVTNSKIQVQTDYVKISRLQIRRVGASSGNFIIERHSAADNMMIDQCIFYDNTSYDVGMIVLGGTSNRIHNCLFIKDYPLNLGWGASYGGIAKHLTVVYIEGSPVAGNNGIVEGSGGSNQVHKSYAGGWDTDFANGGGWNSSTYNASSDTSATGTGAVTSVPLSTTTFEAVSTSVGSCDFRIKNTGALHQAGGSRDAAVLKDILDNDRPASNVAIGCVEYYTAGGGGGSTGYQFINVF